MRKDEREREEKMKRRKGEEIKWKRERGRRR